jgi:hypothetical protein
MIEFDSQLVQIDGFDLQEMPIREFMVRAFVSRSMMDLGQKNINFGFVDKTERRTKRIVVRNKVEVPLLYSIKKSGSIASGDIIFSESRAGVIRGYGTREIEFVFDPSLPGPFQEKITIENVLNPENDQAVIVKAHIKQHDTFMIEALKASFGVCRVDYLPVAQSITISNTSKKLVRQFEVRVNPDDLNFSNFNAEIWFAVEGDDDETSQKMLLSKEAEERIEQLEQKHKIATRKGQTEKISKIEEELKMLRSGKSPSQIGKLDPVGDEIAEKTKDALIHKVKSTEHSIIFSINPRCIKLVKVYFKPLSKSPDRMVFPKLRRISSLNNNLTDNSEECSISVYINEKKNTDLLKTVVFKAYVCFDDDVYEKMKNEFQILPEESNLINIPSPQMPFKEVKRAEPIGKAQTSMSVERPVIDLGKVDLNELRDCYFVLSNQTDENINYIVSCKPEYKQFIKKLKTRGHLGPHELREISLSIQPRNVGLESTQLIIRSSINFEHHVTVTFIYCVVKGPYLEIEKNSDDDFDLQFNDPKNGIYDLDMKYCFVDYAKKFAKVVPVNVKNISKSKCFFSAQSNLAQQCFIFTDSKLEVMFGSNLIELAPGEVVPVYIALQPSLIQSPGANISRSIDGGSLSADYRSLIGGIRFPVSIANNCPNAELISKKIHLDSKGNIVVYTHSLKFTATIGQSILSISNSMIDFGSEVELGQRLVGTIIIQNATSKMPLKFKLVNTSKYVELENMDGFIAPMDESIQSSHITTKSVAFEFTAKKFGYYEEQITCYNLNNSSQIVSIKIKAFVDPNSIQVSGSLVKMAANHLVLEWDQVYVVPRASALCPSVETSSATEREIEIKNITSRTIVIEARSDLKIPVVLTVNQQKDTKFMESARENLRVGYIYEIFDLKLKPLQKARVKLFPPAPKDAENEKVMNGKVFKQCGTLLLIDKASSVELKAININMQCTMSIGSIEPRALQLGKVGHVTLWNDIKGSFTIYNQSDVELRYEISHPAFIEIWVENDGGRRKEHSIAPGGNHIVRCILKPRLLPSGIEGPQSDAVNFVNLCNPGNSQNVIINYHVTQFELKFERLNNGELVLPPLYHSPEPNVLPCDNWFSIINPSDHEVMFEINCQIDQDVMGLIGLEVLSRVSSTAYDGRSCTIAPNSSLEIKIRAYAKETARIADSSLVDSSGIIFGTFSITSKIPSSVSEISKDRNICEMLAIRGTLVEGKFFSVSENQLIFSSANFSDSDDEVEDIRKNVRVGEARSIKITNLSLFIPLELRISLEYPIEFSSTDNFFEISPLDANGIVKIEPNSSIELYLILRQSSIYGSSEEMRLNILDLKSIRNFKCVIPIIFQESSSEILYEEVKVNQLFEKTVAMTEPSVPAASTRIDRTQSEIVTRMSTATAIPTYRKNCIELKGFKRSPTSNGEGYSGMYVLDLGTLEVSSSPLVKKISLESENGSTISFKIYNSFYEDNAWLTFSKSEGTLDYLNGFSCSVLFNVSLQNPGQYCSYIIIENLDNPLDIKYGRVILKLCAKHNLRRINALEGAAINPSNSLFSISIHTNHSPSAINVGSVAYEAEYSGRYFDIINWENVALEFSVRITIPAEDQSEVIFSRTRNTIESFDTIKVEPKSSRSVFLHFILLPFANVAEKSFEIVVECTSITENERRILFEATCFEKKLVLSSRELYYNDYTKKPHSVTITNQSKQAFEGQIVNGSLHYNLEMIQQKLGSNRSRLQSITTRLKKYFDGVSEENTIDKINAFTKITGFSIEPLGNLTLRITPDSDGTAKVYLS